MMAAMQGWAGAAKALLANKAAINARDHKGRLAIDYADPGDHEITNLLQKAGSKPSTGHSGRTVCDAERVLDRLGYDTPIIDCSAGPQLRSVITRFQKENSLSPTGELDAATRTALKIR
jgi:peptidoglycan hydrolase-like protein with peptidoglycan-binding domain